MSNSTSNDAAISPSIDRFVSRIRGTPPGACPLTVQYAALCTAMLQTCGKCVPCRDGLPQLAALLRSVLEGTADPTAPNEIRRLAVMIRDTADCAIGWQTASDVLTGLELFRAEYESHISDHQCPAGDAQRIPCVHLCPAHVNVPGYIALVRAGDYAGAIRLIRQDNPFPTACAMICEHPCEVRCRRQLLDEPINIRGLKKYAVDQIPADSVPVPERMPETGKRVAVIGGGPAGLTAAYFLALMGHGVTVLERHEKLGGMLRYGIPGYRFPKERLDEDIRAILSVGGIEVKTGVSVGTDCTLASLRAEYDAVFVAIGAQGGIILDTEGSDAKNVESAVDLLARVAGGERPDYRGETVVVIGGGNVAIDIARTAVRCGAEDVRIVYRRRREDMSAQIAEVEAAIAEGVTLMTMQAIGRIEKDAEGRCAALITEPQRVGFYRRGRPVPVSAGAPPLRIPCTHILLAVGQEVLSKPFAESGIPVSRGILQAQPDTSVQGLPGVFVGGDCALGPATVIRAIAAGKTAAYSIDSYLGFHHVLRSGITVPEPWENERRQLGRANVAERPAFETKHDFHHVECPFSAEEAMQEAGRCLRCDCYGCGVLESAKD